MPAAAVTDSVNWAAIVAGAAVWLVVVVVKIRQLMGRGDGPQHEVREVSQSLVADVGGYIGELFLAAVVICAPHPWHPMIATQAAQAWTETLTSDPGAGLAWLGAKTFGGVAAYIAIRYHVGNFHHPR